MLERNRIYRGDGLETLRKLPEESVHLVMTSPPYNLGIEYENADEERPYEDCLKQMQENWAEYARLLKSGGRLCIKT